MTAKANCREPNRFAHRSLKQAIGCRSIAFWRGRGEIGRPTRRHHSPGRNEPSRKQNTAELADQVHLNRDLARQRPNLSRDADVTRHRGQ